MPVVAFFFALMLSLPFYAEDIFVENEISLVQMQLVRPVRLHHGSSSMSPRISERTRASENYWIGSNESPRSPASCIRVWHIPNGSFTISIQGTVEVLPNRKECLSRKIPIVWLSYLSSWSSLLWLYLIFFKMSTFGLHRTPKQWDPL